jgi:N4-gp56 family major capsid protein
MTQISNETAITFTYALKKYGVSIAKEVVHTSATDYIKFARNQLIYDVSKKIDDACAAALGGATPAATLYGGDASSGATLETGDVLTTDLIAKAKGELRKKSYIPEDAKPFILFIAPEQEVALLKDPQFVNAAEYGSNTVVMTGEIGKYLGIRVIVTTRTPAKTVGGASWGADGHECYLVKAKDCGAIVWFEKPSIDGEYKKDEGMTNIYLDTAYAVDSLQDNAIVFIRVTDA